MSQITTHVLDTAAGQPGRNIKISLSLKEDQNWHKIAEGVTDTDGRITDLLRSDLKIEAGMYRIRFDTGGYFDKLGGQGFYPYVDVIFTVKHTEEHYHIPLLLSPFGYSTYRGS